MRAAKFAAWLFQWAILLAIVLQFTGLLNGQSIEERATVLIHGYGPAGVDKLTGVVIQSDGHQATVLTNAHLLTDRPQRITVWPIGHPQPYAASVIAARDPRETDVAILRIQYTGDLPAVPLATADPLNGTPVQSIGYGSSTRQRPMAGHVVNAGRWQSGHYNLTFESRSGDSGSPVFAGGQVVGLVWGNADMAFCEPPSKIRRVVETDCRMIGGRMQCQSPGYRVIQSQPAVTAPVPPSQPSIDYARLTQAIVDRLATDERFRGPAGPPGQDGKDGRDGAPGADAVIDHRRLADQVFANLSATHIDQIAARVRQRIAGEIHYELVPDN